MPKTISEVNLLSDLQSDPWVMEPLKLDALIRQVAYIESCMGKDDSIFSGNAGVEAQAGRGKKPSYDTVGRTAVIEINGTLMKGAVPWYFSWLGIAATCYGDIAESIHEAMGNENIDSILLKIDSPGGQVAGVGETADLIYQARQQKKVTAFIEDMGASGAYWLASQADEIVTNRNGMVGSIGVYMVAVDTSKAAEDEGIKVHVIRSGDHKGMGVAGAPISDKQIDAYQKVIDGMAGNFRAAVERGRKASKEDVAEWADGKVFIASKAKSMGLIDRIQGNLSDVINSITVKGDIPMGDTNETSNAVQVDPDAMEQKGADSEKKRFADLKAAFPDDLQFAAEQYEAGASVQEAKAAYADVLKERNSALQTENDALKADNEKGDQTTTVRGTSPVSGSDGPAGESQGDLVSLARERARERNISTTEAMKQVARENPKLRPPRPIPGG